jgi:hypothetical protein
MHAAAQQAWQVTMYTCKLDSGLPRRDLSCVGMFPAYPITPIPRKLMMDDSHWPWGQPWTRLVKHPAKVPTLVMHLIITDTEQPMY